MKKTLLLLIVPALLIGFSSSCKRDWICQCTVISNDSIINTPINGGTFLHAEHTCKASGERCSLITLSN